VEVIKREPLTLTIEDADETILPAEWERIEGPGADDYPGFQIRDDDVADWAVQKIAAARAEYARLRELADREIDRITEKLTAAKRRMEADTDYLTARLADYASTVTPSKVTKTGSTYKLLHGTLRHRTGGLDYQRDEAELLRWLQDTGRADLIKLKASPDWSGLKKQIAVLADGTAVIEATGEVVDGVTVERKPDEFSVEVD